MSFITRYQWYLTGITFTLVAVSLVRQGMRGRGAGAVGRRAAGGSGAAQADLAPSATRGEDGATVHDRLVTAGQHRNNRRRAKGSSTSWNRPAPTSTPSATCTPSSTGCEDCLRIGGTWVHLRLCLQCGHVGCCDQSPNKHATAHFHADHHPLIQSFEPGEDWMYCYVDDVMMEPA